MENLRLDKSLKIKLITAFVLSCGISVVAFNSIGKKNSALLFLSAFLTIFALSMIKDSKKSVLIFIVSFPILVTARKFFYVDFFIFKLSFESIYISALFVKDFPKIIMEIKATFKSDDKHRFNYILYTFVFIVLAINSTMFSSDCFRSIRLVFISVIIPIMFMLCIIANFKAKDLKNIMYAMILQCSFSSIYGFMQIAKIAAHGISLHRISAHRMEYTFGYHNVNIYAAIAILIVPLIIERILYHDNTKNEKLFLYGTCLINVMGILATFTRGAWLMLMLAVAILLISKKYRKFLYGASALLLIGIKPLSSFILHRGMGSSFDLLANESLLARIEATFTSIRMIFDYPFGIGAGNYGAMYKKYIVEGYNMLPYSFRTKITVASYNMEHAHNLFLQIGTELGILTSIVFIVIVVNRLRYTFKNFATQRAFAAALITYFVYSVMTGGELEHKGVITGTLLLWLVFAMIHIISNSSKEEEKIQEVKL